MPPKRTRNAAPEDDAPSKRLKPDDAKKLVAKKPVSKKPVTKQPAAKKPVAKKSVAKKPVAEKPIAKPVSRKKAASKAAPKSKVTTTKATTTVAKKAPAKAASTEAKAASKTASKRSASEIEETTDAPVAKKPKSTPSEEPKVGKKIDRLDVIYAGPSKPLRKLPAKKIVNERVYTKPLDIFVCGEGSNAELGLGTARGQTEVKRPRFNAGISEKNIVRLAAGGMHVLALTEDGQIYSWGVNDQGALGRDTRWDGGLRDMDASSDTDSDSEGDTGLNPHEANPAPIDAKFFHPGTVIVDIAAGDSCSFALSAEGRVYGWGTFRSNEGILGFSKDIVVQYTPTLVTSVKNIKKIAAGENHVLALDDNGIVWAWGSGQQSQLGRRIIERTKQEGLVPTSVVTKGKSSKRRTKITNIGCGAYCSFAVDADGDVWSWGANNYGECGHFDNAGENNAIVLTPTLIEGLQSEGERRTIDHITGGAHHAVAVANDGKCFVWGRCDGGQSGIPLEDLVKDHVITNTGLRASAVEEAEGQVLTRTYKILAHPTAIPSVGTDAVFAACGSDHTIVLTRQGKACTSGFSANYQTGQGTDTDIPVSTMVDNTATRQRRLIWAGAGGQYSIFAAEKAAVDSN